MAGNRSALIAASFEYQDLKLQELRSPAIDAEELARVLRDPSVGDFDVRVMPNRPDHIIRREIGQFFANRHRDDLLLLHFSCHGIKDDDGNLYFASTDTDVSNLEATAVSAEWVNRQITRSRSRRVVLLLDCCYSGAFASGMVPKGDDSVHIKERFEGDGRGRVVLTASNAMEYAWEGNTLLGSGQPSLFTKALVEGLETGTADADLDGWVSVDELYDFVYARVVETTPKQKPGKWSFDVEGELHIARSKFRSYVTVLPHELRSVIDSSLPGVREGAVQELGRLLRGTDSIVAQGARAALDSLATDENVKVAAAARATIAGFDRNEDLTIVLPEPAPTTGREPTAGGVQQKPPKEIDLTSGASGEPTTTEEDPATRAASGSPLHLETEPKRPPARRRPPDQKREADRPEPGPKPPVGTKTRWPKPNLVWIAVAVPAIALIVAAVALNERGGGARRPQPPLLSPGILFVRDDVLHLVTSDGTPGESLLNETGVHSPAWSPDWTRIAYVRDGNLYVMKADGSEKQLLTETEEAEDHPAWSRDGSKIAFGREERPGSNTMDIFVIDLGTNVEHQLTSNPDVDENGPTWSLDDSKIAYRSGKDPSQIVVINSEDGSGPQPLISGSTVRAPAWSPDGSKIAFRLDRRVYVIEADGRGTELPVTEGDGLALEAAPAWSPDGSMLAFEGATSEGGPKDIYVVNLDTQELTRLTSTQNDETEPTW